MTPNHFSLSALPFTAGIIQCALNPRPDWDAENAAPIFASDHSVDLRPASGTAWPQRDWRLLPATDGAANQEMALDWNLIEGRVHFQTARLREENVRWQANRLSRLTALSVPLSPPAENEAP